MGSHAAAGRRKSHFDRHVMQAVFQLDDGHVVNQAQVDDVHGDFRIVHAFQRIPYPFFKRGVFIQFSRLRGGFRRFRSQGVRIFPGDAGQAMVRSHGIGAAQYLGDIHAFPLRQREHIPAGDLDRRHFSFEFYYLVQHKSLRLKEHPATDMRGREQAPRGRTALRHPEPSAQEQHKGYLHHRRGQKLFCRDRKRPS